MGRPPWAAAGPLAGFFRCEGMPAARRGRLPHKNRAALCCSGWAHPKRYCVTELAIENGRDLLAEMQLLRGTLKAVLSGISEAFLLLDRDWRLTYANDRAAELTGIPAPKLLGSSIWEAFPDAAGTKFEIELRRAMTERVPIEFECFHAALGRWLAHRVCPAPGGLCVFTVDITERESQDFVENAVVALHWASSDGRILWANQAELDLLGYSREEYVGHNIAEFHVDQEVVAEILRRLANHEELHNFEARLQSKDGSIRHLLIDSNVYWRDGEFVHTRSFTRDITDRKRAEEALEEADRRKDEFLAMLAHELRNPLAPIRSGLEIMRLRRGDPATIESTRQIMERQVEQLVRLVDDLVDVSRITRGQIKLQNEMVDLATVVGTAVETCRAMIEARQHRLTISLPPGPVRLEADSARLTQVVANLLDNAAKYTEIGGNIWLTAECYESEVSIRVRDSGTGIPAMMLPHVFDLFTQVGRSLDRAHGGLGIGLTLVRALVEMHGGRVEASSPGAGQGSEFIVRLPLARKDTAWPRTPEGFASRAAASPSRRVLVVDDNADVAETLAMLLRFTGHEVRAAYDGPMALDTVRAFQPEVVLLDIGLPGMDGFEVARSIRREVQDPNVLLVALTGYGQEEDRLRSKEAGFEYHLVKPVDPGALQVLLGSLARAASTQPRP